MRATHDDEALQRRRIRAFFLFLAGLFVALLVAAFSAAFFQDQ
jgi:hypothetical protein